MGPNNCQEIILHPDFTLLMVHVQLHAEISTGKT